MKHITTLFVFLFAATLLNAQCPGSALTITATPTTASCPNNGVIAITAGGGVPAYQYAITAGPTTRPLQSSNVFNSLAPGTYTVRVQDACSNAITANAIVTNTYPAFSVSSVTNTASTCPVTQNGTVTVNATGGNVTKTYSLLQGATTIYGPQATNIFTGVAPGTYTAQVTDGCGEIRTFITTVTLNDVTANVSATNDNNVTGNPFINTVAPSPFDTTKNYRAMDGPLMISCDSIAFRFYDKIFPAGYMHTIYVRDLITNNIVFNQTKSFGFGNSVKLAINRPYRFYFDDLCNRIDSVDRNYNYENTANLSISNATISSTICNNYSMAISRPTNSGRINSYNSPYDTVTIIASTVPGDTVVGKSVIYNLTNLSIVTTERFFGVTPGATYTYKVSTICSTYTKTVTVAIPNTTFDVVTRIIYSQCKQDLSSFDIVPGNNANYSVIGNYTIRLLSGPASYTDVDGINYTFTYPIVYTPGAPSNSVTFKNIPKGTYTLQVTNQCGDVSPVKTVTITDNNLMKIWSPNVQINQACNGSSSIVFTDSLQSGAFTTTVTYTNPTTGVSQVIYNVNQQFVAKQKFTLSLPNLSDGNYSITVTPPTSFSGFLTTGINTCTPILLQQDFTIQYRLPVLAVNSGGFVCTPGGSDGKLELHTQYGVSPFTFQRLNTTTNAVITTQTDSVFTGLARGTHRFRVTDFCGNAVVQDLSIDTLDNPSVSTTGASCVGKNFKLITSKINSSATVLWTSPTGATYTTDTVNIAAITASDFGIWTVAQQIPGCSNIKTSTYNLTNVAPNAGADIAVCQSQVATMAGISTGGVWSALAGNPSTTSIAAPSSNNTTISGFTMPNLYQFVWTANATGCTDTVGVTVNALPSIAAIAGTATICVGQTTTLANVTNGGAWKSVSTSVANVNSSTGLVTGLSAGTSIIRYTVINASSCIDSVSINIRVNPKPIVASISGTTMACVNKSTTLIDATSNGVWTSTNTSVATINTTTGEVTGISAGTSSIAYTVTDANGCIDSANTTVTINALPVVATITGNASVCVGKTTLLGNITSSGVWKSESTNVATVNNSTGLVTGISNGTSIIRYTVTNANGCIDSVYTTVTVNALPNAGTDKNVVCFATDAAVMTATGTGTWSGVAGNPGTANIVTSTSATTTIDGFSAAGTYNFIWTNAAGCTDTVTILVGSACTCPIANNTIITSSSLQCTPFAGITIDANAATPLSVTYQWQVSSNGGAFVNATGISTNEDYATGALVAGVYKFTRVTSYVGTPTCTRNSDTLTITVNPKPNAGANHFFECGSQPLTDTLKATTIGGVWTASSTNATGTNLLGNVLSLPVAPTQGTWGFIYTVNGCTDTMNVTIGVTGNPMLGVNMGSNPICKNGTVQLCPTVWGWSNYQWYKNGAAVATPQGISSCITLDSTGIGSYTLASSNASGCWSNLSTPIVVTYDNTCGDTSVTGGGGGGVESKTLGDVIATRLYGNAVNSKTEVTAYTNSNKFVNSGIVVNGTQDLSLGQLVPATVANTDNAYVTTPTDLVNFTNAVEVLAVDYAKGNTTKAVAFGTKTLGDIYSHTKPICDRLKGAELLEVKNINVNGFNLMAYKVRQRTGETEYAINLSAGTASNRNTISLQSNWFTDSYQQDEKLYNFQLWAVSYEMVTAMAKNIITKLQANGTINVVTTADLPKAYISKGSRKGTDLTVTIQNNTTATSGYFEMKEKANENSNVTTRQIPFTVNANGISNVTIPVKDNYEGNVYVYLNNKLTDLVYLSDGTWALDYNKNTTSISSFNVTNETNVLNLTNEHKLFRNVAVTGTSKDYITIYKTMMGGGLEQNVADFKSIVFNANATGASKVQVTLVKKSIANWNEQYTYAMDLDGNKEYGINFSQFKSSKFTGAINANDIVAVNFSFLNSRGTPTTMNINLSKARFTNSAIATAIEVSTVGVYPNPSNGKFTTKFTSEVAMPLVLKVIEISTGRVVKTQFINATKGVNQVAVALDKTSVNGLYLVSLEGDGVKYNATKLMVSTY